MDRIKNTGICQKEKDVNLQYLMLSQSFRYVSTRDYILIKLATVEVLFDKGLRS